MSSIYRPRFAFIAPDTDVRHGAHIDTEAAAPVSLPVAAAADDAAHWIPLRKAQPVNVLLPSTLRWLESLPIDHRPATLAAQFPRLANLIAADWGSPRACSSFIYSLLLDQRGGRRGFPEEVLHDILGLRSYYATLHPVLEGVWTSEDAFQHLPSQPAKAQR